MRTEYKSFWLFTISLLILSFLNYSWYAALSLAMLFAYAFYFVSYLGRRILIFELTALLAILTWLVVPLLFYAYFNINNELAVLWDKYMRVPPYEYYTFAIPATVLMILGLHVPLKNYSVRDFPVDYYERIRSFLTNKGIIGFVLIAIGLSARLLSDYVPAALGFVFFLLEYLTIVGVLYIYYSKVAGRKLYLVLGVTALLIQALSSAMFGQLIFIAFLSVSVMSAATNMRMRTKVSLIAAGLLTVLLIQSVKQEYRTVAWSQGANPIFFMRAVGQKIIHPEELLDPYMSFTIASRANQGWHIAKTMYHVPEQYPFAYGETILKSFAAIIIPRVMWPGKPESGGKANLKRFWGMEISGYSMNLGPVGEAYANFGRTGGIIFMFFYGLVLNFFLSTVLGWVKKYPTLLLWFPILFLYPIGTETDILSTLNPLVKISIFIVLLFSLLPRLLALRLG